MVEARPRDEIDKLYKTKRWQKLRPIVISRDFGLCQECLRRNVIRKGNIVHHKIEAREDLSLFWDVDNLELSCDGCHNKEHPERSGGEKKKRTRINTVKFYANNE